MGLSAIPDIPQANQTSVIITPTRTSYLLNAGPVIINMTYLSPVEVRLFLDLGVDEYPY